MKDIDINVKFHTYLLIKNRCHLSSIKASFKTAANITIIPIYTNKITITIPQYLQSQSPFLV